MNVATFTYPAQHFIVLFTMTYNVEPCTHLTYGVLLAFFLIYQSITLATVFSSDAELTQGTDVDCPRSFTLNLPWTYIYRVLESRSQAR